MTLAEKQRTLIEDLNLIPDIQERLGALTAYAARMKLAAEHQIEANLVPGCVSRVWLHGELLDGRARFDCEADSPMVKALAAVLCDLYSDATPGEVIEVEPAIWAGCQFTKMLSPTRLNGLAAVRRRIREMAERFVLG
ncbi:MAG: SufE family protein [Verrucomicrobiaceae bacterium]|nr:SufE family protein [Verrucomicrobiaceae bacterium]